MKKKKLVIYTEPRAKKVVIYAESRADAEFVQELFKRLESLGLSHGELARRAKISQPTISRLLAGKHSPSLRTVERIAHALDCEVQVKLRNR